MIDVIMEKSEALAKLGEKLNKMAFDLGAMTADGNNTYSGYKYISHEQASAKATNLCAKYNVALIPSYDRAEEREVGGKLTRTIVNGSVLILDCETGATIRAGMCGADQDTMGKSCGQAETEAFKRFLAKLFRFSTIDDRDPDSKSVPIESSNVYEKPVANPATPVQSSSRQTTSAPVASKSRRISPQQRKTLYQTAKVNGYSDKEFQRLIREKNYASSGDIKVEDYSHILGEFSVPPSEKIAF